MQYEYWLASIMKIAPAKKIQLREKMGSAKSVYYIEETQLRALDCLTDQDRENLREAKELWKMDREYQSFIKTGIHVVYYFENKYPTGLREINDSPYAIFYKGSLPDPAKRSIAIVGARNCTGYGEKYAHEFAKALAENGIQIISGLARGIDGISQRGALMGGGKTFAVLGNGVDICYPREHIGLFMDILESGGGILSEYPPGTQPLPLNFPRRNRLISGLSEIVIIIEAKEKSGSLITADMALDQGKDIYALPGPVNSLLSCGCNRLIQQGAGILLSVEKFLEEIGIDEKNKPASNNSIKKVLESTENMVYSTFAVCSKNLGQIIAETELPANEVMSTLVSLEIKGYIKEISKNNYIKC